MGRLQRSVALAGAGLWLVGGAVDAAPVSVLSGKTTSTSGQFVIYSKDAARRSLLAQRAEASRAIWNEKLGSDGNWSHPIIIQDLIGSARPRGNPNAVTRIYEGDGGALKVQTSIYDASVPGGEALDREIFRALGLEAIYRTAPLKAGKSFRSPPDWMVEGLAEEGRIRSSGTPPGVFAALLRSEQPPKIEDFLRAKPELMEATSLALYRTQAVALIRALRGLPEGGRGMAAFVASLAEEDSDLKALLAAFPSLQGDASRLGKVWTLAIARDSAASGGQPMGIAETGRALKGLLDFSAPADPKKPELGLVTGAEALPLVARGEGGAYLMRQKSAELFALEFRAHPLLRPVIAEYRQLTTDLAQKPRRNVEKRLTENGKIYELLMQRSGQVDDYMNWFEATQLDTLSGEFFSITNPPQAERRTDPVTQYVDAVEGRGW